MFELILASLFVVLLLFITYQIFSNKDIYAFKQNLDNENVSIPQSINKKHALSKKQPRNVENSEKALTKNDIHDNPWLCTILKGHTDDILDFTLSLDEETLITCSKDHFILIWNTSEFSKGHNPLRLNLAPDYADHVRFSPDNKAFILHLVNSNILRVYAISKKVSPKMFKHRDLPKPHAAKMVGFEVLSFHSILMYYYVDCTILFTNFKGEKLMDMKADHISLEEVIYTQSARFIATRGLSGEVGLWETSEVSMDYMGPLKRITNLELDTPIKAFAFSYDSTKIVVVGEDLSWKIWDFLDKDSLKVRKVPILYSSASGWGRPPMLKMKMSKTDKALKKITAAEGNEREFTKNYERITCALSRDFSSLAITSYLSPHSDIDYSSFECGGFRMSLHTTRDGKLIDKLKDDPTCPEVSLIEWPTKMAYALQDSYLLMSGNKLLYVLHNVVGDKAKAFGQ